ncbi:glycosyl hydrolase family 3 N terminal domain-containing protein [Neurospora crassa]|nr:glycosyl hydrolase family 3 N terminal domain-containing protein [Neurospora crassa]
MAAHDPSKQGLLGSTSTEHHVDYSSDSDDNVNVNTTPKRPAHRQKQQRTRRTQPTNPTLPTFQPLPTRKSWLARRSRYCLIFAAFGLILFVILLVGGGLGYKAALQEPPYGLSPPWYPSPKGGIAGTWYESYQKAAKLVSKMTLAEKVNITTGVGWQMGLAVGTTAPAVLVGFPALQLQDGPLGIRNADNITAFPAGITVGATWNRQLMYARGKAHAIEARAKGVNAILGPCVGPLGRMPAGGRNWEGFGSDPYLQGIAGAETIKGIQSEGVMATVKHFIANEQEHFRQPWEWGLPNAISSNVDDRTLHELYAWPFGDAVKAGVASVMCSYNMVNNSYACGNSKLLNGILKDELGFQGFVMSDWLAQRAGVSTALAGLDMTMPGDGLRWANGKSLWGKELSKAVLNGSVPVERMDDMATRVVAAWYQMGQDNEEKWPRDKGPNFSSWTNDQMGVVSPGSPTEQETVVVNQFVDVQANHSVIARQVAAEGTVLLKNEGPVLPLSRAGLRKRQDANDTSDRVKIGIFGEDAGPIPGGPNSCPDRGCNQGTLGSGWGSGAVEFPYLVTPVEALRKQFDSSEVELHEHLSNQLPFSLSEKAVIDDLDLCLVFVNADAGEGFKAWENVRGDRPDLFLQKNGDALIQEVAARCGGGFSDVVVVIHAVGPVVMERWIDLPQIKAVVFANLPGEESGNALVDVLFGHVNPSGHLPFTIGKSLEDYGPGGQVLYLPNGVVPQQNFSEGLYVDYRWFDKKGITPRFEFGYGLSYTPFELGNATVKTIRPKSALPFPRLDDLVEPPTYSTDIPPVEEVLWPEGDKEVRKLDKYIYPYLSAEEAHNAVASRKGGRKYPYPDGYDTPAPLSQAGGDEGGNPELWAVYAKVTVDVRNTGKAAGAVVPQLYLSYPDVPKESANGPGQVDFPVKVLRGFDKVYLEAGKSAKVEFNLTRRDLSYWDVEVQNWVMIMEGEYTFHSGDSDWQPPLHLTPSRQSSPGLDREAVHTLQEWPPQHAQQPPASASRSSSSSLQYSLQETPPFDFDFSCDFLSDYDFLHQQQQQDFNWADPLLFPDQQDLTSLAFPISTTTTTTTPTTCDTAPTSTTVSPFAPSLPLSVTPSPLLADTNDIFQQQGWADPSPSAPPQPPMHLSLDHHHLSSDDPYAAASLSHVTDTLSTTMGLTMPSGRNTTTLGMDMYRTASNNSGSSSNNMGYSQLNATISSSSRDHSTTPPTSQSSGSTSPTASTSHHGHGGQGHLYPGLTLPSPVDASSKPKRGRPPGPKKRALSPGIAAEAELTDSEDIMIKRQRNNIAAKKYRQKKIDRIQELEEEVDQIKKEREELRLMLAKRDAEVGMLREMLAMAKQGR